MPRQFFLFERPRRFVAGTVGAPGERTFYLQAADGSRVVSVALEKQQVAVLADRLEQLLEEVESSEDGGGDDDALHPDEDPLLEEAIALVAQMGTASTSMLQRRLRLGYTRAGRLIDMLERRGVISGYEGSKPRQVLMTEADVPRILAHFSESGGSDPVRVPDE